ncbi:hypothetical protein GNX14_24140 [Mesorhizobium japonicum]|uniref:hypothetical protein n=1 Tax=Mesorhizobium TaxID=68287 RepID=UPI0009ECF710|nr:MULTISPECIES: hypothetical protein [Mesorhizobium]MUT24262.1 hypothetical protein [Mesorhizobium japonicum]
MEKITTIGLDIAKHVFQAHGINGADASVSRPTHGLSPRESQLAQGLFRPFRKQIRLIQTIAFTNPGEPRIVRFRDALRARNNHPLKKQIA